MGLPIWARLAVAEAGWLDLPYGRWLAVSGDGLPLPYGMWIPKLSVELTWIGIDPTGGILIRERMGGGDALAGMTKRRRGRLMGQRQGFSSLND